MFAGSHPRFSTINCNTVSESVRSRVLCLPCEYAATQPGLLSKRDRALGGETELKETSDNRPARCRRARSSLFSRELDRQQLRGLVNPAVLYS